MTSLPFDLPARQEPREEVVTIYTTKAIAEQIRELAERSGNSVALVGHHILEKAFETQGEPRRRRATDAA